MLKGKKVALRARYEEDIPVLRTELYTDVEGGSRADGRPWMPLPPGVKDPRLHVDNKDPLNVPFSIVDVDSGHVGLGLLPGARGKGYGADTVAVLCHYGFVVRGLQRLQVETLADNHAMLRAAERNGFVREGVLRKSAWVMGEFLDDVILGLLAEEWKSAAANGS
jgi:GNAT superfamily N-acetyltransferase